MSFFGNYQVLYVKLHSSTWLTFPVVAWKLTVFRDVGVYIGQTTVGLWTTTLEDCQLSWQFLPSIFCLPQSRGADPGSKLKRITGGHSRSVHVAAPVRFWWICEFCCTFLHLAPRSDKNWSERRMVDLTYRLHSHDASREMAEHTQTLPGHTWHVWSHGWTRYITMRHAFLDLKTVRSSRKREQTLLVADGMYIGSWRSTNDTMHP